MPRGAPQRIAVVGAGAIGSYYGMRLAQVGHDVRFLMRRDYDAVNLGGLHLSSPLGDLSLQSPTIERTSEALAAHGPVDWLLIGLKATALPQLPSLARPLLSDGTRVLAILNGLTIEQEVSGYLPGHSVFGGMGFIGVSRGEPGRVNHQEFGALNVGHYGDDPDELERAVNLFEGTVVEIRPEPCLLKARWEKLGWNIPFNGLCVVAGGASADQIIHNPALRDAAERTLREVLAAGNADLAAQGQDARIDVEDVVERYMTLTAGMAPYHPSTSIDFREGRPLEVEAMFEIPASRASELGVKVPMMSMLAALARLLAGS